MLGYDYLIVRLSYELYMLDTKKYLEFYEYLNKYIYIKALCRKASIDIYSVDLKFTYLDDKILYLEDKVFGRSGGFGSR